MKPELKAHDTGVSELFAYRNGEAHLGVVDTTLRTRAFVSFLEGVKAVLGDDAELWKPHEEAAGLPSMRTPSAFTEMSSSALRGLANASISSGPPSARVTPLRSLCSR